MVMFRFEFTWVCNSNKLADRSEKKQKNEFQLKFTLVIQYNIIRIIYSGIAGRSTYLYIH